MGVPMSSDTQADQGRFTATTSLSRGSERMRAHRQRRKAGLRCVTVELRETEVTELIKRGLLKADARHDLHAIRSAIHSHLDVSLGA
jgi:hypothetical protein